MIQNVYYMRYMMMRVYEMLTLTSYRLTVPAGKSDKLIITNKEAAPGLPTSNNNTPTKLPQTLFMWEEHFPRSKMDPYFILIITTGEMLQ